MGDSLIVRQVGTPQNDNQKGILRLSVFGCPSQNDNSDSHTDTL